MTLSDTSNYLIDTNGVITLTQAGVTLVNTGQDLPDFTVSATSDTGDIGISQGINLVNTIDVNDIASTPTLTMSISETAFTAKSVGESGNFENSTIDADTGDDTIIAGDGFWNINLGIGSDTLNIGTSDGGTIDGGTGDDIITAGEGWSSIDGGTGDDTTILKGLELDWNLVMTTATSASATYIPTGEVTTLTNVEHVIFGDRMSLTNTFTPNADTFDTVAPVIDLTAATIVSDGGTGFQELNTTSVARDGVTPTTTGADTMIIGDDWNAINLGTGNDNAQIGDAAIGWATFNADTGMDNVIMGDGWDKVLLGTGDDTLNIGISDGLSSIDGGTGDDIIIADYGWRSIDGGTDEDTVIFKGDASEWYVNNDDNSLINSVYNIASGITTTLTNVERVEFGGTDANLISVDTSETVDSVAGVTIVGDKIEVESAPKETYTATTNKLEIGNGWDALTLMTGNNEVVIGTGSEESSRNTGNTGNDIIMVGDSWETIFTGTGNDTLFAGNAGKAIDSYEYTITLNAGLTDTDGSESLSDIILTSLPTDVTLLDTDGKNILVNTDGSYTISIDTDGNTSVTIVSTSAIGAEVLGGITATVVSTELSNGATAEMSTQAKLEIIGTDDSDSIIGTDADEKIDARAGQDTINAGAGDDTIVFDSDDTSIDGGIGYDILHFDSGSNITIDFNNLSNNIANIEVLDLSDMSGNMSLNLDINDVLNMTDEDNSLTIFGNEGDNLILALNEAEGEWSSTTDDSGDAFKTFVGTIDTQTIQLMVDANIDLIGA